MSGCKAAKFCVAVMIGSLCAPAAGNAQTFAMLYGFQGGSDGSFPTARLLQDKEGNLYGTTLGGGSLTCNSGEGCGTVFELSSGGAESVLYAFAKRSKGIRPVFGLVEGNKGDLYGTTVEGGSGLGCGAEGCGVVFKVTPDGKETVRYSFQGADDAGVPDSDLIKDAGNYYGMTSAGGTTTCKTHGTKVDGCGTIFKLAADGTETVLYRFQGGSDGQEPYGDLAIDAAANLYGTTQFGGGGGSCDRKSGCGTVFKLAPDGTETVLYAFQGGLDGSLPVGGVILDSGGNLYGTTQEGGSRGYGTVFRVDPDGDEDVIYSFCAQTNCTDGAYPESGVIMDKAGNLLGTANDGGNGSCDGGCGVVYKISAHGAETILHSFDGSDGENPYGGLIMDKSGILFGTTNSGGPSQLGVIYSITK